MSPCCDALLKAEPYGYADYQTGYRDEGCAYRCTACGEVYDEQDLVAVERKEARLA